MKNLFLLFSVFLFLCVVIIMMISWHTYPKPMWLSWAIGSFLLAIGSVVLLFIHIKDKRKEMKEKPIKEKIMELQSKGVALHHEEIVELTLLNKNKVRASIRNTILFILLVAVVGVSVVYFLSEGWIPVIALIVFIVFLMGIASYSISKMNDILRDNQKTVIRGIITNERQETVGTGRGRNIKYYKTIGSHELEVDANVNRRYSLGQAVEIHYAFHGKMIPYIFEEHLLPEAGIPSEN